LGGRGAGGLLQSGGVWDQVEGGIVAAVFSLMLSLVSFLWRSACDERNHSFPFFFFKCPRGGEGGAAREWYQKHPSFTVYKRAVAAACIILIIVVVVIFSQGGKCVIHLS
jgi:hypothetical protein